VSYRTNPAPLCNLTSNHMSIAIAIIVVILTLACIVAANALISLFDVKDATPEQSQAEAEKLLAQSKAEVRYTAAFGPERQAMPH